LIGDRLAMEIALGAGRAIFVTEPRGAIVMPMDAKEFKRRVAEHFENVTEVEFLRNLQKSSPYLFIKGSGEPKEVQTQSKSVTDNNAIVKHD
jgi:hypothetical protein